MSELAAWLLERLAEDEAHWGPLAERAVDPYAQFHRRMLAQVEAHRAIVELHQISTDDIYDADGIERPGKDCVECWDEYPCRTLRALANVYADAPGFREEWRRG